MIRKIRRAKPWHLTTVQFRTLAWHIAHQPFGVVAGARQYQHARIAIFEGYAGSSATFPGGREPRQATDRQEGLPASARAGSPMR
jgi:hypothetical protein